MTMALSHLESSCWNLNKSTGVTEVSAQGKPGLSNTPWLGIPFSNALPSFILGLLSSKGRPFCVDSNTHQKGKRKYMIGARAKISL